MHGCSGVPYCAIFACMAGVNFLTSSALYVCDDVSVREVLLNTRMAPMPYPSDFHAGELDSTWGSTSVVRMEMLLSLLRRISQVRNCRGKSRSEGVSTSQKPYSGWAVSGDGCGVTTFTWRCPAINRLRFG